MRASKETYPLFKYVLIYNIWYWYLLEGCNYIVYFAALLRCGHYLHRDLKTWKSTGTSCHIEIHFSIKTTRFLIRYNLLCFLISGRLFFTYWHDHQVSTRFHREIESYKWIKIAEWFSLESNEEVGIETQCGWPLTSRNNDLVSLWELLFAFVSAGSLRFSHHLFGLFDQSKIFTISFKMVI
jgi:hypothetical protein